MPNRLLLIHDRDDGEAMFQDLHNGLNLRNIWKALIVENAHDQVPVYSGT